MPPHWSHIFRVNWALWLPVLPPVPATSGAASGLAGAPGTLPLVGMQV
jgi:hypothetical protein